MEILIIIGLVLINGVFSMSEMSLVSSRKFKLESARKKGSSGAKTALELYDDPTKFLSTVQIGITLIGILLGVYSGQNLTNDVEGFINKFELIAPFSRSIAVGIIVVFVTYLTIVLGELLPKRLGMTFPEPIAEWADINPYSIEGQVLLTLAMMDDLRLDEVVLVGHSAGGAVALQMMLSQPERVEALILVAPA
ncbi:MAG: alpha/beta fold hydrolase, partial [Lutibacter sp.]